MALLGTARMALGMRLRPKMAAEVRSEALLGQADSVWKMLDDLAESDPEAYKRFIDKTFKEGSNMFRPPEPCFLHQYCFGKWRDCEVV